MCHYKTLGIARAANKDVIRKAYLTLAKKYHPDINKAASANAMFQKIQEAYSTLSDASKKRDYDTNLGSSSSSSTTSTGGFGRQQDHGFQRSTTERPYDEQRPPRYEDYAGFPGGARQYWKWKAQMDAQEVEEEYRRARDAQAREYARQRSYGYTEYEFNHDTFRQRMMWGLGRILPMFIPILIIMSILRASVRRNRSQVIYDEQGRAYIRDQQGVPHRMREFDLR